MFKLIIFVQYDSKSEMKPSEVELDLEFNESQAELRALRWLTYRPYDIVMMEPV